MGRPLVVASHRQPEPEAFAVSLGRATRCSASARMRRGRTRRRSVRQFHHTRCIALAAVAAPVLLTVASLASAYLACNAAENHHRESSRWRRAASGRARRIADVYRYSKQSISSSVGQSTLRLRHEGQAPAMTALESSILSRSKRLTQFPIGWRNAAATHFHGACTAVAINQSQGPPGATDVAVSAHWAPGLAPWRPKRAPR